MMVLGRPRSRLELLKKLRDAMRTNNTAYCMEVLDFLEQEFPETFRVHERALVARVLLLAGRVGRAAEYLDRMPPAHQSNYWYRFAMMQLHMAQGTPAEAAGIIREYLDSHEKYTEGSYRKLKENRFTKHNRTFMAYAQRCARESGDRALLQAVEDRIRILGYARLPVPAMSFEEREAVREDVRKYRCISVVPVSFETESTVRPRKPRVRRKNKHQLEQEATA